jgi:Asp/Glu/hydantoin racemase
LRRAAVGQGGGDSIAAVAPHLLVINPNTDLAVTRSMHEIAAAAAPASIAVHACTVPFGAALITDEQALDDAGHAVLAALSAADLGACIGVIVSAFGDPGLDAARQRTSVPVTGIAEAGMAEAARGGRRFAVVTTTPNLVRAITAKAAVYGHDRQFTGVRVTPGAPQLLMQQPQALLDALERACDDAMRLDGAQAIVIGGGPLARAARALQTRITVPLVEPVPAAVRLAVARVTSPW